MQSSSRNGANVRVLAVHTTEGIMRAAALRAWKGWKGSSHAAADDTGVLLAGAADGFVDYSLAAWTLRSGNPWSENIELCGFAKWRRADWLARPKLLDACAHWLADRSVARGIPLRKLTPKEYRAGQFGVIGHHDHTVGYSDGTHWDPGPEFPWDVVLDKARAYAGGSTPPTSEEDDMTPEQAQQLHDLHVWVKGNPAWPNNILQAILDDTSQIEDIKTRVYPGGNIDSFQDLRMRIDWVLALLAKPDSAALSNVPTGDLRAIAQAVNDEADRRERDGDPTTGSPS